MTKKRKTKARKVGDTVPVQFFRTQPDGQHWWFVLPEGMVPDADMLPELHRTGALHGPFKTDAEAPRDAEKALLGEDCKVVYGGQWPPSSATH